MYQFIMWSVCELKSYTTVLSCKTTCFTSLNGIFWGRKWYLLESKTSCFTVRSHIPSTLKTAPLLLHLRSYPILFSLFPNSTSLCLRLRLWCYACSLLLVNKFPDKSPQSHHPSFQDSIRAKAKTVASL